MTQEAPEIGRLSLTRKPGDRIYIGPDVVILIKEVRGGKVRMDIEAPKTIQIWRGEIKPDGQ